MDSSRQGRGRNTAVPARANWKRCRRSNWRLSSVNCSLSARTTSCAPTGIAAPIWAYPLNWMPEKFLDLDGSLIQCSSHGALFQIDSGECIAGPCTGDRLQQVELRIDGDSIYVAANQPMPAAPINLRAQALADLEDS